MLKNKLKMIKNTLMVLILLSGLTTQLAVAVEANAYDMPILSGVGGDFTAVDSNGKDIKFSDYKGQTLVLAFGYTNCADICPFTLGYLKQLYTKLSNKEQKKTHFIFITIDPEYDTPKHLKSFVEFFNKDFIGLSGSKEQIEHITSLYQAEYNNLSDGKVSTKEIRRTTPQKSEAEDEKASLFSHTIMLYLVDKEGYTRSIEYTGTPKEQFADKIRELINE